MGSRLAVNPYKAYSNPAIAASDHSVFNSPQLLILQSTVRKAHTRVNSYGSDSVKPVAKLIPGGQ